MDRKSGAFVFLVCLLAVSSLVGGETKPAFTGKDVSSVHLDGGRLGVYYFYGKGCPACARVEPFLAEMEHKYPLQLRKFDVYSNRSSLSLFDDYCSKYGLSLESMGVPALFVSDTYFVGDSPILDGLEEVIEKTLHPSALSSVADQVLEMEAPESSDLEVASAAVSLSIFTVTVAALVDAISPCSIGILVFLIGARVLVADRKKRALKVGLAFCLSVFIAYFLFGLGLFTVVQASGFSGIFSLLVGLIAVLAGIFYLKDAFWYGRGGFAMEVPRSLKPLLMKMLKGVTSPFGAFVMGFVAVCFELPCTGGPYLFILGQIAHTATRLQAIPLLLYYNFIFVLPLAIISLLLYSNLFSIVKVREWSDQNKLFLKLIGGFTLMALGFVVIPTSQVVHSIQLFLECFKAIGPLVIAIIFFYNFALTVKQKRLRNGMRRGGLCSLLVSLLAVTPFLFLGPSNLSLASPDHVSTVTRVYVDPPMSYANQGERFTVDLDVADVENLYAWQANMSFDPSVLQVVNVTEGDFLKLQPQGTFFFSIIEEGWAAFACITLGMHLGVNGNGTLASIEFLVLAFGESALNINHSATILLGIHPPPVPPGEDPMYEIVCAKENGIFIPSTIELIMDETTSSTHTLTETIICQNATLNTSVKGDFDAALNFTNLEIVLINSGAFAGRGFSTGNWSTNIEGTPYQGSWQGVLFKKPEERKIYLEGMVSGGLRGIVEGFLSESVNGSDIYDRYQATWTISYIGAYIVFAKLDLNGTVDYQGSAEYSSELYALQTSIQGEASGYYNGSLSVVLTHVRVNNETNPYYDQGFSTISYDTEFGSGEGWTYDKGVSPSVVELNGLFTGPLTGIISGRLDESGSSRTLSIAIERIDLGLPPMADLKVEIWGPERVSPGQTIDYIIEYGNDGLKAAEDVVVVVQLPYDVDYASSTKNGTYYPKEHETFWKLGTIEGKMRGRLTVKVRYHWGLGGGTTHDISALIGASNPSRGDTLSNIQKYLTYEPVKIVSAEVLPTDDVASALVVELSDQNVSDLHSYSNELGYNYSRTIIRLELSDGSKITRIMMLNDSNHPIFITNLNDSMYFLELYLNDTILFFDRYGGMSYNFLDNSYDGWGTWNISGSPSYWQCVRNGIAEKVPGWALSEAANLLTGGWAIAAKIALALPDCAGCVWNLFSEGELTTDCASCLSTGIKSVPAAGEMIDAVGILIDCHKNTNKHACVPGSTKGICARDRGLHYRFFDSEARYEMICSDNGVWEEGSYTICDAYPPCGPCPNGNGKCIDGKCECDVPTHKSRIAVAWDPNIKYGPEGYVLAGQTLNYTVEYENEGEGIAFGVYFADTLDESFNASTLEIGPVFSTKDGSVIADPGTYNPSLRTITWFVGEVGPGEGGYANFSAMVRNDASEHTEIINYATVYFPSVPETTRTNGVVSVVGQPNVAVTNVTGSESVIERASTLDIDVTAANKGYFPETFNLTLYVNTTALQTQNITLLGRSSDIITFLWNTTGFAKGNYTLSAYAWPVLGEVETDDNLYVDGIVQVTVLDDVPPVTNLSVGEPNFVIDYTFYLTSATPITLIAEDDLSGSGVASTAYRIYNATYDGGWTTYTHPFYLIGLSDGTYRIDYNSTDNAGNIESSHAATVILDNAGPSIAIVNPPAGWALQDGVTFEASAIDAESGVFSVNFSIREANGAEGKPVGFEDLPATYNATTDKWALPFDTLQLPDGYYIVLVNADDNLGHTGSTIVPYSIRNLAVLELLPATESNKAGRTMPVKFSLRVAEAVDSAQPFVYNDELTIRIYEEDHAEDLLQESIFGDTARDYRIDSVGELYITNFKTLKNKPTTYIVEICRKGMPIGSFTFETVK